MDSLINSYNDILYATIKGSGCIDDESKVYLSFLNFLFNELKSEDYFDCETFEEVIIKHLKNINTKHALNNKEEYLNELIGEIKESLNENVKDYFLIVPMQKSMLDEDIIFDEFMLLKKN